jgi:tetratricopeptide (TPR) repeat protein
LHRLDDGAARQTFLAGTCGQFEDDPALDGLLRELEGWPLAVTLLAYQARFYADLQELADAWRKKRAALLTKGVKKREADIGASIEMSLGCPLLTADARRLLALLGILPDGIRRADLAELLPPDGVEAAAALRRVGGLAFDEGPRLRVLAPVREYLAANCPPGGDDRVRAIDFFCRLAGDGEKVGGLGGAEASARITAEVGNLAAMVRMGLKAADPEAATQGALALGEFSRFSGVDLSSVLVEAGRIAHEAGNIWRQANCIKRRGDIALERSDHAEARRCYAEARSLYGQIGVVRGAADCISGLGHIALARSDHAEARRCYTEARPLYQQVGAVLGEAYCIKSLGNIALERSDYTEARRCYEEARPLFQQVDDVLGEANCIKSVGDIALECSDHEEARRCYEQARPLYKQVGAVLGEATCIEGLGHTALQRAEHSEARRCYAEARPLYQQVGAVLGEANCIRGLGRIFHKEGDVAVARELFEQALVLYQRIEEPCSVGITCRWLARVTDTAERQHHIQAAREAWTRIDRPDLVAELDKEFAPPP